MNNGCLIRRRLRGLTFAAAVVAGGALSPSPLAAQGASGSTVTFTKDVAPILQRSCVGCHRPDQIAPMSLRTYEEVRPWARSIKARVTSRSMAPWHIDKNVGIQEFENDLSLPDKDIATIAAWVDAGAPRGNPADMPAQRQFADGDEWAIGKPDLIVRFPAQTVPASGPDLFPNITAPTGLSSAGEKSLIVRQRGRPRSPRPPSRCKHLLGSAPPSQHRAAVIIDRRRRRRAARVRQAPEQ